MLIISRMLAALSVAALTLSGCMAEDPSLLSPEERQIRSIEKQRSQTATLAGAGAGALVGLLASRGESREETLRNVLIGTAIGGGLGYATGEYVNTRARRFNNERQAYQALIASADRDIANYRSLNRTSQRLISQQRSKIRRLNSQLNSGAVSADQYRTQLASAANNIRSLDKGIADINQQVNVMKSDRDNIRRAGKSTSDLTNRITALEQQKRTLQTRRRQLATVYDEVPDSVGAYDF